MPRFRILLVIALLGALVAVVWSWPEDSEHTGPDAAGVHHSPVSGELPPSVVGGAGELSGTVLAVGEPVPGASVWVTHAGGALGREPCPCDYDDAELLLDLFCDCVEAEELLTEAILAGHGEPDPVATADTAPDGTFAVQSLAPGDYTLWAEHRTAGIGVLTNVPAGGAPVVIDLEPALAFSGTVIGDADLPVQAAEVVAVHTLTNRFRFTSTDADGHFELLTHTAGEYFLVARAPGYFPSLEFFFPEQDANLVVYLDSPRRIAGRVLESDNSPAAAVEVTLRGWGRREITLTDGRGRFDFEEVRPGEYYVVAEHRRQLDGKLVEVLAGEDRTEVILRLRDVFGGELFGVVRTRSGEPVAGAEVLVTGDDTWGDETALTDEAGRYQMRPLPAGFYDLEAEAPGVGRACVEIDILASEPTELDLTLGEEARARGVVVMADGTPVGQAPIWLEGTPVDLDQDDDHGDGGFGDYYDYSGHDYEAHIELQICGDEESTTAADGTFTLRATAGDHLLVVLYGGPEPYEHRVTLPDSDIRVEVPPHARVRGQVLDARGRPVPLAHLALISADGMSNPYETDSDGRFALEGLTDGPYELRADTAFGLSPTAVVAFDVHDGEGPDDLILQFEPGMSISGRVTLPTGEPAPSGMVRATHTGTGGVGHTDIYEGDFLLEDVPGGRYVLEAFVPGNPMAFVRARGGQANVAIQLHAGRTVTGRVLDAGSGNPIADATVSADLEQGATNSIPMTGTDSDGRFRLDRLWNNDVLLTVAIDSVPVHRARVPSSQSRVIMAIERPETRVADQVDPELAVDVDLWSDDPGY